MPPVPSSTLATHVTASNDNDEFAKAARQTIRSSSRAVLIAEAHWATKIKIWDTDDTVSAGSTRRFDELETALPLEYVELRFPSSRGTVQNQSNIMTRYFRLYRSKRASTLRS
jgi:hypothetical protein